jgi:uncharacterized membrane protein
MKNLYYLLFPFGIISAAIAIYQVTQGTTLWGSLSVLYSVIFFISGWLNYKKAKK